MITYWKSLSNVQIQSSRADELLLREFFQADSPPANGSRQHYYHPVFAKLNSSHPLSNNNQQPSIIKLWSDPLVLFEVIWSNHNQQPSLINHWWTLTTIDLPLFVHPCWTAVKCHWLSIDSPWLVSADKPIVNHWLTINYGPFGMKFQALAVKC